MLFKNAVTESHIIIIPAKEFVFKVYFFKILCITRIGIVAILFKKQITGIGFILVMSYLSINNRAMCEFMVYRKTL